MTSQIRSYVVCLHILSKLQNANKSEVKSELQNSQTHLGNVNNALNPRSERNKVFFKKHKKTLITISVIFLLGMGIGFLTLNEDGKMNRSTTLEVKEQSSIHRKESERITNKITESKEKDVTSSTENQIEYIRKVFSDINSATLNQRKIKYNDKCGVIDATITVYTNNNGEVRKITDTGTGDDDKAPAKWTYQYYYENEELVFSYESSSGFDNETEKQYSYETREYFSSNKMIRQIKNGKISIHQNSSIDLSDIRYKLKEVTNKSDIDRIYQCLN